MPPRAYEAGGWRTVTVVIAGNAQRRLPYYPKLWSGCVAVIDAFKRPLSQRSPVYGAASRLFAGLLVCYMPLARPPASAAPQL